MFQVLSPEQSEMENETPPVAKLSLDEVLSGTELRIRKLYSMKIT